MWLNCSAKIQVSAEAMDNTITRSRPALVVLAAGMGSRYGGLKQIEPVGPQGEVILDYSLYDAKRGGFEDVVFIIRREIEQVFHEKIGMTAGRYFNIRYAYQELDACLPSGFTVPAGRVKPWGTAHALLCAGDVIQGPFAVINADDYYGRDAFRVVYDQLAATGEGGVKPEFCMIGYILDNTLSDHGSVSRGVCRINEDGCLESITECEKIERHDGVIRYRVDSDQYAELDSKSIVSMNCFGFTQHFLKEIESRFPAFLKAGGDSQKAECYMPAVLNTLLQEKQVRVRVMTTDDQWLGVTYREDVQPVRDQFRRLAEAGVYPERLWI